ncbi:MAG: DUF4127 family protein, partial [Candidatus Eremiobacteraeota bacterium]|nr:DUF4127 family protein [Candidatus Eremiobacteraeota bacterium]
MFACISLAPALGAVAPSSVRIAFVPMDDRPATEQFPQATAAICGAQLVVPPHELLGHFTEAGDTGALGRWLADLDTTSLSALVVSADMLAYGGLVASRTAATPLEDARERVQELARFHDAHPALPIYVFGTIMRLTPTETPKSEAYLEPLAAYARAAGAVLPGADQIAELARVRAQIPDAAFWDYIGARARDVETDESLITLAEQGSLRWLAITQDDAGYPDGLQIDDQRRLGAAIEQLGVRDRVLMSAGADEMGMIAVTRAIEDATGWHPRVRVVYSGPRAPSITDPLKDVPVGRTIENLARALAAQGDADKPDFSLYVLAPSTPPDNRGAFFRLLTTQLAADAPIAVADLTFIDDDLSEERLAFETLRARGVATRPLAFASWNTTANSAGTALAA